MPARGFSFLVLMLAAVGCGPQSAKITEGQYTAFLPTETSKTLLKDSVKIEDYGSDKGPGEGGSKWRFDCRDEDDATLEGGLDICDDIEAKHESWMLRDGFEVVSAPLDPWAGEAVITSEGDLQLTFHNRLPGGEDFRFSFVVDPNFQPKTCVLGDEGNASAEPIDGDWLENWADEEAADAEDADDEYPISSYKTMFLLNAGSYQFNPSDTETTWTLPQEWLAGYTEGKFADDILGLRTARYGLPKAYTAYETSLNTSNITLADLFYVGTSDTPNYESKYDTLVEKAEGVRREIVDEYALVGVDIEPKIHTNRWREPDLAAPGLDSWLELQYNWVGFDQAASELSVGNPATGEFHLLLDGANSLTRVLIRGKFEVKKIRKDRWTIDNLEEVKLEENGTTLCE